MRAHVLTKYGKTNAVLAMQETAEPALAPDQVRVRVQAAALNPVDLKTREGEPKMLLPFSPPFVLGVDFAGTVSEVGSAVRSLEVGDGVFAYTGMDRMGAFAESVVIDEARVAKRPAHMSPEEAACLPLPALCAMQALDEGDVTKGSRVLVHGGAGGVGSIAVQLASQRGAEVFSTVSAGDFDHARALGAAHPIDYRSQRFEEVARDMDFIFDTVGGETLRRSWSAIKRGGVIASLHVPPSASAIASAGLRASWLLRLALPLVTRGAHSAARRAGARLAPIMTVPSGSALSVVARSAESRGLRVHVDKVFPFEALVPAFEHLTSGKAKGRVVLTRA